jgi:hypothetical protein
MVVYSPRLFEFSICIIVNFFTNGTFGKFASGVEKKSSNDITTTSSSRFGFEVSKWSSENKRRDAKGPRDEEITLLSYITKSPPTTSRFLLERKII